MCERKKNDLKTTYSNNSEPIEEAALPVYICGEKNYLAQMQKLYTIHGANNKDSICRGLLEEDALTKGEVSSHPLRLQT